MLYERRNMEPPGPKYLMGYGADSENQIPDRHTAPTAARGELIKYLLYTDIEYADDFGRDLERMHAFSEEATSAQPCSVDIRLSKFSDMDGRPLNFPIEIAPHADIIGYSGLFINEEPDVLFCAETRSSMARRGHVCMGFYDSREYYTAFRERSGPLNFVMRNCLPVPQIIERPFSPLQITATLSKDASKMPISTTMRLIRNGRDVTGENKTSINGSIVYVIHLGNEMAYVDKLSGPVSLTEDDFERHLVRTTTDRIQDINPEFCLTITEEEIETNGCPAYMYPFHYHDAVRDSIMLSSPDFLNGFFYRTFNSNKYLPVTGNAGVIQPGPPGERRKTVCENVTDGRDLAKYFRPGEPFALIVPVPFHPTPLIRSAHGEFYGGKSLGQQGITVY